MDLVFFTERFITVPEVTVPANQLRVTIIFLLSLVLTFTSSALPLTCHCESTTSEDYLIVIIGSLMGENKFQILSKFSSDFALAL